jgi:hypothetical protein
MNIIKTKSKDGAKKFYSIEFNRRAGGRIATGIYTYTYPENQQQKNHNKDALRILEIKTSEMTLEHQAAGTGFIPTHKFMENFFDYYQEYVNLNKRYGNRHLEGSLLHFKNFIKKEFIAPVDIN